MKDEKGWHRCPACDEAFFKKKDLMFHVFEQHVSQKTLITVHVGKCWCVPCRNGLLGHMYYEDWCRHIKENGGLDAHYHAHLIGITP